ncbi:hypothetical protein [Microseira wollei]|nr:hypothetical protein [Microseira wollei]
MPYFDFPSVTTSGLTIAGETPAPQECATRVRHDADKSDKHQRLSAFICG